MMMQSGEQPGIVASPHPESGPCAFRWRLGSTHVVIHMPTAVWLALAAATLADANAALQATVTHIVSDYCGGPITIAAGDTSTKCPAKVTSGGLTGSDPRL